MADISTGEFNYDSIDAETASKLKYFAKTGKSLIRKSQIQFIADMGKLLSEARDVLSQHRNGTFVKWAVAEFDISNQTAYNYINAWEKLLSNDLTIYLNWSPTALYLLASDEIPKPVQKKLAKLPATEFIRLKYVKQLIEESKPKPEPEEHTAETDVQADTEVEYSPDGEVITPDDHDSPSVSADPEPEEAEIVEASSASIVLDARGRHVPEKFREAHQLAITLMSVGRELDKFRQRAKELHSQPGGEWLHMQNIDEGVRSLKAAFQDAGYHTLCTFCEGSDKTCKKCHGIGWLPDYFKGTIN